MPRDALLIVLPLAACGVALLALWVWALVDCLAHQGDQGGGRLAWTLVILLGSWVGALVYVLVPRRARLAAERTSVARRGDERADRRRQRQELRP